jgi:hypothetical protein
LRVARRRKNSRKGEIIRRGEEGREERRLPRVQ